MPELLALLSIGVAQGISMTALVPRIALIALAVLISVALLLTRRGDSLLLLGIATMTLVSFEPAPCDVFFGFYILYSLYIASKSWGEPFQRWRRLPRVLRLSLYVFVLLNLVILLVNPSLSSARFALITFYLIALFVTISVSSSSDALVSAVARAYLASFLYVIAAAWVNTESFIGSRFQGWFKDPNVLAAHTVPAILLVLALITSSTRDASHRERLPILSRLLALTGLLVLIVIFLWTASRGALVGLAPGLALLLALCWQRRWTRPVAAIATAGLILTALWLSPLPETLLNLDSLKTFTAKGARFAWVFDRLTKPDVGRLNTYSAGLKAALAYPMGVGPGNYERHVVEFADPSLPLALAAHNLYLRTWVEQGLLGLISLVLFLGSAFHLILQRVRKSIREHSLAWAMEIAIPAALVSIYAHSLLIDTLHWRHLWILLGVGVGTSINTLRESRR